MSSPFPLITDWMERGLAWRWVRSAKLTSFTIPAGGEVQLPYADFTYKYPEIILCHFTAGFDHPECGLRIEAHPEYDSEHGFKVANFLLAGGDRPETLVYGIVPPHTPPGLYVIRIPSFWPIEDWCRLYVFNDDSADHKCISFAYLLVALLKKRPEDPIVALKKLQLIFEMYPGMRETMREKLGEQAEKVIKTLNTYKIVKEVE